MTFPIIMRAIDRTVVVFFISDSSGIVVQCSDPEYKVGEYETDWNMAKFKKYNGELKMSNAILLAAFLQ